MNADYRALCDELTNDLEEWVEGYLINDPADEHTAASLERIDRARAALAADPEPPADGEVAELVAELIRTANFLDDDWYHGSARVARRAADLLSRLAPQPVPEGPSDEDIDELAWNWYSKSGSTWYQVDSFRAFARAVLARWGHPHTTPHTPGA